ncbi:MAG: hypothetical protein LBM92_01605, partial [Opitutaceae bacterium]|nr:hypothetical protein [Opitutaceae bacterium]
MRAQGSPQKQQQCILTGIFSERRFHGMATRKFLILSAFAFFVVRALKLLWKKENRIFPLLFILFLLGWSITLVGVTRCMAGDYSFRSSKLGVWWQEVLFGAFMMVAAIGYSLPQIKKRMDK